jgi:hypothetical protein
MSVPLLLLLLLPPLFLLLLWLVLLLARTSTPTDVTSRGFMLWRDGRAPQLGVRGYTEAGVDGTAASATAAIAAAATTPVLIAAVSGFKPHMLYMIHT